MTDRRLLGDGVETEEERKEHGRTGHDRDSLPMRGRHARESRHHAPS
jgi:hypothetical protein